MPKLNTIIFCGEKLSNLTVKRLFERFNDLNIINAYGPTECTFAVTSINITKDFLNKEIPIGIPKDDVKVFIVDDKKCILKDGEVGEILVTGESVARRVFEK